MLSLSPNSMSQSSSSSSSSGSSVIVSPHKEDTSLASSLGTSGMGERPKGKRRRGSYSGGGFKRCGGGGGRRGGGPSSCCCSVSEIRCLDMIANLPSVISDSNK